MNFFLKVFGRSAVLFIIGFLLVSLASFLVSLYFSITLLIIFLAISFFISYKMPLWFELFSKCRRYEGQYRERLLAIINDRNVTIKEIYLINRLSVQGTAIGMGNTKSVVFSKYLMEKYPFNELEAVLAHELGHHINKDVWIHSVLLPILLFISGWIVISSIPYSPSAWISIFVVTLGLLLLSLKISRWREHLADVYAKNNLENPGDFASFLERSIRLEEEKGNQVEKDPWYKFLYTHPWVYDRIDFFKE